MANGHGGARPGSGRKPSDHREEYVPDDASYHFWVEGRIIIRHYDEETKVKRDRLVQVLKELDMGLSPLQTKVVGGDDAPIRRRWSQRTVTLEEIASVVATHPGILSKDLAEELYRPEGHPWSVGQQKQAEAKLSVSMSKLVSGGRIVRRYNIHGQAVHFPPSHPDIERFARTRSGRHELNVGREAPFLHNYAASLPESAEKDILLGLLMKLKDRLTPEEQQQLRQEARRKTAKLDWPINAKTKATTRNSSWETLMKKDTNNE